MKPRAWRTYGELARVDLGLALDDPDEEPATLAAHLQRDIRNITLALDELERDEE